MVTRSLVSKPVSEATAMNSEGVAMVVSMVSVRAVDAALVLPAVSVAWAVSVWVASLSTLVVMVQAPRPPAVAWPTRLAPSYKETTLLASALPVTVGVVTPVIPSLVERPMSEPGAKARALGAAMAVSMVTISAEEARLVLPARSTPVAVRV